VRVGDGTAAGPVGAGDAVGRVRPDRVGDGAAVGVAGLGAAVLGTGLGVSSAGPLRVGRPDRNFRRWNYGIVIALTRMVEARRASTSCMLTHLQC